MKGCDLLILGVVVTTEGIENQKKEERMILTFSDAVAILVPCRFKAMQLKTPS